ncbi:Dehydrodolichyl diphosphate synthase complex subunit NUS1 [Fulvia fulva]|uniref:ditrans,polycis-polyprenyl diphosphate synthase [(2E,6E)-farnesyldiphosphate specific] n=1 Tax=Passalora fulva TaxID=5499 RepID=A0A9Q8P2R8_PASFU|nr:Dehydrodolichyl diphosphate synthase complex subunit NUS1 [Fulvia fulva]KAK4637813.1 Dehydrodolichyl diphosphate synthase complex subunit NUS1 [Fulvia fulva]UJO11039.1 Dehydrodolichyl diphosphate synthase complex subunit NUS1 [Fulvia fulva]
MPGLRQAQAFRENAPISERERILKPYLPRESNMSKRPSASASCSTNSGPRFHHRQRVRPAMRHIVHSLLFNLIHIVFSVSVRCRQIYHALLDRAFAVLYYHHRTPGLIKRDVAGLSRVPKHLSVILEVKDGKDGLEGVMGDACELAAWSASAGVGLLSVYERSAILKSSLPHLHRRITRTLTSYYGNNNTSKPTISLRSPNQPSYSPPDSPELTNDSQSPHHLTILLLDATDGRQTLVDLTKTLAEMSQHGKLSPSDISQELIDAEITESVMGEPDMLICFGERVVLEGYPPWQIRLTEIFYAQDNGGGVGYQVFLRALYRYAKAEFRFGR